MENKNAQDWILRFVKGMFIGVGAILPGVSGGALAAVFGLYERMISFIAHITRDFKRNFLYFFPVGLGGIFGIFLLSFAVSFFLENYEAQVLWFFIGCIIGILPSLGRAAAKKGRKPVHIVIMLITSVLTLLFLRNAQHLFAVQLPMNVFTWFLAGGLMGLGMIVPGLSPSNFLIYMNMYKSMTDGIKNLDFAVIVPLGLGVVFIVLALSKIFDFIFSKAYTLMFHIILGVIIASTVIIVPVNFAYVGLGALICGAACLLGILLGSWMSKLEDDYKPKR